MRVIRTSLRIFQGLGKLLSYSERCNFEVVHGLGSSLEKFANCLCGIPNFGTDMLDGLPKRGELVFDPCPTIAKSIT